MTNIYTIYILINILVIYIQTHTVICEPHMNHKAKLIVDYTKIIRKECRRTTKESHQTTREDSKRKKN